MSAADFHCGTVGITGRPNTGKSSLLNRLIGQKLSIVSPKAQTTRHLVTGILSVPGCQYVFVDSPGFQTLHTNMFNKSLNRRATEAARDADVVLWVIAAPKLVEADRNFLSRVPAGQKVIAVANKIDLAKDAERMMPLLEEISKARTFHAIVPVSAKSGKNVDELMRVIREALPVAPALYPEDQLTDRDERFFASELVREKLFRELGEELPYSCEVAIDSFKEEGALRRIEATIWVDRESHKPIVIGDKGERLKRIGTAARKDMERLFDGKVYLGLWVKVKRGWTEDERALRSFGYN
ncbi:MAG: GTPase Era [Burkholderiales bacterium]|jgi:GTP-binding protein Era